MECKKKIAFPKGIYQMVISLKFRELFRKCKGRMMVWHGQTLSMVHSLHHNKLAKEMGGAMISYFTNSFVKCPPDSHFANSQTLTLIRASLFLLAQTNPHLLFSLCKFWWGTKRKMNLWHNVCKNSVNMFRKARTNVGWNNLPVTPTKQQPYTFP